MKDVVALIVAAGAGRRFGGETPKAFVELGGAPLLLWALHAYDSCPAFTRLLLAVSPAHIGRAEAIIRDAPLTKPVLVIAGGSRRQDTVFAGLKSLACEPPEIVAVHDAARPLTDTDTIAKSVELARSFGACVTAAPVTDTIKRVDAENVVSETPDRGELWRAQTPQTFAYALLLDCYERAMAEGWEVTDDASVVERCGHVVRVNPGSSSNIKITTPEDLRHAEAIIGAQQRGVSDVQAAASILPRVRIGHGYDAHALTEGRKLIIGGVEIPHETGLAGHSDADVLFHAICDALLGAAAGGDIGALFPDDDSSLKDIDSAILCQRVTAHIRGLGYGVLNLDATVIAQRPKLAPHIPAMRENIASALGAEVARVSVKATTTEHLGFEGREEGIAVHAVALLSCGVPHVREVAPH